MGRILLMIKTYEAQFASASRDVQLRAQYRSSFALTVLRNLEREAIKL